MISNSILYCWKILIISFQCSWEHWESFGIFIFTFCPLKFVLSFEFSKIYFSLSVSSEEKDGGTYNALYQDVDFFKDKKSTVLGNKFMRNSVSCPVIVLFFVFFTINAYKYLLPIICVGFLQGMSPLHLFSILWILILYSDFIVHLCRSLISINLILQNFCVYS